MFPWRNAHNEGVKSKRKKEKKQMNTQRAQEILESAQEIDVNYNGTPVWIQHVDKEAGTARVFKAENPEDEMTVPVDQLNEQ